MGSQYLLPQTLKETQYNGGTNQKNRMKTFLLDAGGDLELGDSLGKKITFISGVDKIKQDIYLLIKSTKGSSHLNPIVGVDYDKIYEEDYDPISVETEITEAVMRHPDIQSIKGFKVKSQSDYAPTQDILVRNIYAEFHVITIYGDDIFVSVII